jgi:hypothetical protein
LSAAGGGPISGSRIPSGDEEWRNIHTMLSCISGMAEKTKKAISILQNRGNDVAAGSQASHQEVSMISDLRRQTEERIDEIRRNAEDAVNQVRIIFLFHSFSLLHHLIKYNKFVYDVLSAVLNCFLFCSLFFLFFTHLLIHSLSYSLQFLR